MARTELPLTPAELRRCALALRLLAERTRADALLPANAARREALATHAQEAHDLAVKCQWLAVPGRKG
jgi:hypothetical protein